MNWVLFFQQNVCKIESPRQIVKIQSRMPDPVRKYIFCLVSEQIVSGVVDTQNQWWTKYTDQVLE